MSDHDFNDARDASAAQTRERFVEVDRSTELRSPVRRYRDPPHEHRFKSPISGNPKGRPKGSGRKKSPAEELYEAAQTVFGESLTYVSNGKRRRSASYRPILESLRLAALKGDRHARRDLLKLLDSMRPGRLLFDAEFTKRRLSDAEAAIVATHPDVISWIARNRKDENDCDYSLLDREERDQLRVLLTKGAGIDTSPDAMAREYEKKQWL